MTVVSVGREPAVSGMRNISCWGRGTGLLTDGSAGAARREADKKSYQLNVLQK